MPVVQVPDHQDYLPLVKLPYQKFVVLNLASFLKLAHLCILPSGDGTTKYKNSRLHLTLNLPRYAHHEGS